MRKRRPPVPRWRQAQDWIEEWCRFPDGPWQGQRVLLSLDECVALNAIFEEGKPVSQELSRLAAYLVLLRLASPEGLRGAAPVSNIDTWSVWRAASDELRAVLIRRGEIIICPELGTRFPELPAAA